MHNYPVATESLDTSARSQMIEITDRWKIGVALTTYRNWETVGSLPTLRFRMKLTQFLGFDPVQ